MRTQKTLAVLLTGLLVIGFAGCGRNTAGDNGNTTPSADIGISEATAVSHPDLTDKSSQSLNEITAEKENTESSAPAETVPKVETKKTAEDTAQPTVPNEPPKATGAPEVTERPESKPAESISPSAPPPTTETNPETTAPPAEPSFNIDYWIDYAKNYAKSIGLIINPDAVYCWDNPMIVGSNSKYIERDIKSVMNRYKNIEGFTDIWIWAEPESNGNYRLFIGYA